MYCAQEPTASFYWWKHRLKADAPSEQAATTPRVRAWQAAFESRGGFVQVPVTSSSAIEVRFADGTLLKLPANHLDALTVTLRTLQATQREGDDHD